MKRRRATLAAPGAHRAAEHPPPTAGVRQCQRRLPDALRRAAAEAGAHGRCYGAGFGGPMGYGPDLGDVFRRAGNVVGRVLKGEKPADMPIEEPSRFRLSVNLQTARALGLIMPPGVMILADEVIE